MHGSVTVGLLDRLGGVGQHDFQALLLQIHKHPLPSRRAAFLSSAAQERRQKHIPNNKAGTTALPARSAFAFAKIAKQDSFQLSR